MILNCAGSAFSIAFPNVTQSPFSAAMVDGRRLGVHTEFARTYAHISLGKAQVLALRATRNPTLLDELSAAEPIRAALR